MHVSVRLTVALALLAVLGPATAQAKPPVDGPGRYYVFRTLDTGDDPTADQNARCDAHFGIRAPTAAVRLNARLYSFRSDPRTGRLAGQTAGVLGPGFICGAPTLGDDSFEAYAFTSLPGLGSAESPGTCTIQPVTAQAGSLFFGCRLSLQPDPRQSLAGGTVTSNSIVNPAKLPGSPTGSVWTAYVIRTPGAPKLPLGTPPAGPAPPGDVPGADFYVTRALADHPVAPGSACPGQQVSAARSATLRSVQPALRTSEIVPGSEYTTVGALTACYSQPTGTDGHRAGAQIRLGPESAPLPVSASGTCRDLPTVAGAGLRQQNCTLNVAADSATGVRGGVVTSSGLVHAGAPATSANSAVWTISLFGGRVAPSPANVLPRVRLRVARRPRGRSVRVRWAAARGSGARRFDVQSRRAGRRRWRVLRRATARHALRVRLSRGVRYRFRVRGRDEDDLAGPWVSRVVTVRALRVHGGHR